MTQKKLGIYQVHEVDSGELAYIGSTELPLNRLEYNHRNAHSKGYSMTDFRVALETNQKNFVFSWLEEPRAITREHCEIIEGALIRALDPMYNRSRYPYERSVHEGRFNDIFGDVK